MRILWNKKRRPKTRDYAMVALIKGATKAGVHVDRKKKANKRACREREISAIDAARERAAYCDHCYGEGCSKCL